MPDCDCGTCCDACGHDPECARRSIPDDPSDHYNY